MSNITDRITCSCDQCSESARTLGLRLPVSVEEAIAAHRDLVKVWHPDRFENDPRLRKRAEDTFKNIQAAFDLIKQHLSPNVSNTEDRVTVSIVRGDNPTSSAQSGTSRFELSSADAHRIFHDAIGESNVKLASTLSLSHLLVTAGEFGLTEADSARLLIGSTILLTNTRFLGRGFFNKADIPYWSLPCYEFSLKARKVVKSWGEELFDKMVGNVAEETILLYIEGHRANPYDSIHVFEGENERQMVSLHKCLCQLQTEIRKHNR